MKMKELFDRGEFAVSAEVGPPKGIHVEHYLDIEINIQLRISLKREFLEQ